MAKTKQTVRRGTYQRVDNAPKDDGPKDDGNTPKRSSFDGAWHSLRCVVRISKTNELGKDAVSKDESDDNYTGRDNSEESSVEDNSQEDEIARSSSNSQADLKSREDKNEDNMSSGAGLSVSCTLESNNYDTEPDRK
eukprot:4580076-Ditylum_brightwellii.AAC.1